VTISRTIRLRIALTLAVVLTLGSGWMLFSTDWDPNSTDSVAGQYRTSAVFLVAALLVVVLLIPRGQTATMPPPDPSVLPWWTDPLGEASFDGVFTLDEEALIRSANYGVEEMFGYSIREMVGEPVFRLIPAEAEFSNSAALTRVEGQKGILLRVRGRRSDGTEFPLELRVTEFERGSRKMYLGVCRKLDGEAPEAAGETEARPAEVEARAWADRFMARMGKDINDAATTILGYSDLALEVLHAEDVARLDVREIKRTAEHVAELSQILRILGRAPTGAGAETGLHEWLEEFRSGLGGEVRLELEATAPVVKIERSYLRIVIAYLVGGTAIGRDEGESVVIRTLDAGAGSVCVEIIRPEPPREVVSLPYEVVRGILAKSRGGLEARAEHGGRVRFRITLPVA